MLHVTLMGHLGSDPEPRFTQKGSKMVQFRTAVNFWRRDQDGEGSESTEWFSIRCFGTLADRAEELHKGSRVLVLGRMNITHFTRKSGEPGTGFEVVADELHNLSFTPQGENGNGGSRPHATATAKSDEATETPDEGGDLPF